MFVEVRIDNQRGVALASRANRVGQPLERIGGWLVAVVRLWHHGRVTTEIQEFCSI